MLNLPRLPSLTDLLYNLIVLLAGLFSIFIGL